MAMAELGEIGSAYKETAKVLATLLDEQSNTAGPADTFDEAILQHQIVLDILEDKGVAEVFQAVVDEPLEDPAIAAQREAVELERQAIENIRTSAVFGVAITEDDIQQRLAALPVVPEVQADEDRLFAAAALGGRTAVLEFFAAEKDPAEQQLVPATPTEAIPLPPAAAPEAIPDPVEQQPAQALHVQHYTGDNMLVIGDEAIPLARATGITTATVEEELMAEAYRLAAMKFLAAHPGEEFQSTEIWPEIRLVDESLKSSQWDSMIGDYITEVTYKGDNLFKMRKPGPKAKRRYYSLADQSLIFEEPIDEDSGLEQLTDFKLVTNGIISGRSGKLAHLLLRANRDNPVDTDLLIAKGLTSKAEIDRLKQGDTFLSGSVASLRSSIKDAGAEDFYRVSKHVQVDPKTKHRRATGYWMEIVDPEEMTQNRQDLQAMAETVALLRRERELFSDKGLRMVSSRLVNKFKTHGELKDGEIIIHDETAAWKLIQEWADLVFDNSDVIFELLDSAADDDARWEVVKYLEVIADDGKAEEFRDLLKSKVPAPNNEAGTSGEPANGERRKLKQQLVEEAAPLIQDAVKRLFDIGAMDGEIHYGQIQALFGELHVNNLNKTFRRTEKQKGRQVLNAEQIVLAHVVNCGNDVLARAFRVRKHSRILDEVVKEQIALERTRLERAKAAKS